jgi:hypothetical protein
MAVVVRSDGHRDCGQRKSRARRVIRRRSTCELETQAEVSFLKPDTTLLAPKSDVLIDLADLEAPPADGARHQRQW